MSRPAIAPLARLNDALRLPLAALVLTATVLLSLPARAASAELLDAVQAFLYQQSQGLGDEVQIEVHPPRAAMPACLDPQPFFPGHAEAKMGRVSVGVRCGDDRRRVRYMQAEIQVFGRYPVLARRVEAGTRLTPDMLSFQEGDLGQLPRGALRDIDEAVGQLARRSLAPGAPLQHHQLREIPLVERRQRVSVEARGDGFRISREGEALDAGALGDEVRVRLSRREILTAVVIDRARVAVAF